MEKLDDLLNLLKDETWHNVKEIAEKLNLTIEQTVNLAKTLAQQDLVQYSEKLGWLKINPEYNILLTAKPKPLRKPVIGSMILPAKETITIQDVEVTNLTDTNLEVLIRASKKLTRLSIKTYPSL